MAKFIGRRSRSKEGPRHVTGRGLFTDDFQLPGMLQAMILRSPHAHAKINAIDPSEALKSLNVMAVITPEDMKRLTKPFKPGRYAAGLKRPIDEYAWRRRKSATSVSPSAPWRRAIAARRKTRSS
jgi:CO/xanthine dehydrogenase Mo-binding subunit